MGIPLARFYLSHALFNCQRGEEARAQLHLYLENVAADGPQRRDAEVRTARREASR